MYPYGITLVFCSMDFANSSTVGWKQRLTKHQAPNIEIPIANTPWKYYYDCSIYNTLIALTITVSSIFGDWGSHLHSSRYPPITRKEEKKAYQLSKKRNQNLLKMINCSRRRIIFGEDLRVRRVFVLGMYCDTRIRRRDSHKDLLLQMDNMP